jgi:DNA polymerase-3 subunit alpha
MDADRIYEILIPFADYGFNKSHAAAYSIVAYRTMYLKAHFPAEFIAANLTNEISSSDNKLAPYIEESRSMGIPVDPPDVNRSGVVFDVHDGRIVFGLMGIKGLGASAAEEIVAQRDKDGHYLSFIDFLERVDLHTVNKKAIEVMIKTGAFDKLGQPRSELLINMEKAIEYAEKKKSDSQEGQASLFGGIGESDYDDFHFEHVDDWVLSEKLAAERELIGCNVSGHPLDDYRTLISTSVTLTAAKMKEIWAHNNGSGESKTYLQRMEEAKNKKRYVILGIVKAIKEISIRSGKNAGRTMSFVTLEDMSDSMELVFFSDIWEREHQRIVTDAVLAFRGTIGSNKDNTSPSFTVEEVPDMDSLEKKALHEVHITLAAHATAEDMLVPLRDTLLTEKGDCEVYFHLLGEHGPITIKANTGLLVPASDAFIDGLKANPVIEKVWAE